MNPPLPPRSENKPIFLFSEENCHRYVYLLEISNEGIKTDVQEVVQEGIDTCFSILI